MSAGFWLTTYAEIFVVEKRTIGIQVNLKELNIHKASLIDEIQAEMLEFDGKEATNRLFELDCSM